MARSTRNHLARLFEGDSVGGMTDGQLLDRFATRRGVSAESAFEALVARHGPMVARVCRSTLRDEHDVEDAFQATFLVLVRRAHSIGERDLLAPWLYGVAHKVARKARSVALKRRGREGGPAPVGIDPPARFDGSAAVEVEVGPVLHEEVNRLPEKYRRPVILCHFQGLTHAEAAQELAWPVGTVSVRLARARKILADRLTRRGVTASAALVTTSLATEGSAAALAPTWIQTAAVAAVAASSGFPLATATAAASAGAITLARRTSMTMLLSSWKWLTIPATVALATTAGAVLVGSSGTGDGSQSPSSTASPQVKSAPPGAEVTSGTDSTETKTAGPPTQSQAAQAEFDQKATTEFPMSYDFYGNVDALAKSLAVIQHRHRNATFQIKIFDGKFRLVGQAIKDRLDLTGPSDGGKTPVDPSPPPSGDPKAAATPLAPTLDTNLAGRAPFPSGKPPGDLEEPPVAVPPVVALPEGKFKLGTLPPGYFDLPPSKPGQPGSPQPVQLGQTIQIDVLEALPGRPLAGNRIVRPDGTISLGVYGDLLVVGLNRDQIKVKLIDKLRTHLSDSVLGLLGLYSEENGKVKAIPPLQSNRVFVDDQPEPFSTTLAARESTRKRAATAPPRPVTGPVPVKVGQTLAVEVLEALPGRPITGERVVRLDGTISLGFYGDIAVAGLTRDQIKVKVVEYLRKFLDDEKLGLRAVNPRTQQVETVAPVQTDRVFVADDLDWNLSTTVEPAADGKVQVGQTLAVEVLEALPGRPITGERVVRLDGTISLGFYGDIAVAGLTRDQIKVKIIDHLRAKLTDEQLGLVRTDAQGQQKVVAPVDSDRIFVDDVLLKAEPMADEAVKKLRGQVTDLSGKLDAALEAIEQLRQEKNREPAKAEPTRSP